MLWERRAHGAERKLLKGEGASGAPKEIVETDYEDGIENTKPVDREASKTQVMSGKAEGKAMLAKAEKQVLPQDMMMEVDRAQ